jgi:SAM-dependent methyltransferase
MPSLGQTVYWNAPGVYRGLRRAYDKFLWSKVRGVLAAPSAAPDVTESLVQFDKLLRKYSGLQLDPYLFNDYENWNRAVARVQWLIQNLAELRENTRRVLEIGAGDGMVGKLLADYGHDVTLADFQDWRDPRAKHLPLLQGAIESGIDLPEASVDVVVSYNAFEHFEDPAACVRQLVRVVRPAGLMHFDFGPPFSAPFGMHCYRALPVPYCQFLFPESHVVEYIRSRGHDDLGKRMTELQPMNRWRLSQFDAAWTSSGCTVVSREIFHDRDFLHLVTRFPNSFRGRNLTVDDLTANRIRVTLRRPEIS